jgi:hypothetical protein
MQRIGFATNTPQWRRNTGTVLCNTRNDGSFWHVPNSKKCDNQFRHGEISGSQGDGCVDTVLDAAPQKVTDVSEELTAPII